MPIIIQDNRHHNHGDNNATFNTPPRTDTEGGSRTKFVPSEKATAKLKRSPAPNATTILSRTSPFVPLPERFYGVPSAF